MSAAARRVAPPGGEPAPTRVALAHDLDLDLVALAAEVCRRYRDAFPDERQRYGDAGEAWCAHDNQHVLNWAVLDLRGLLDFDRELGWLARVLEARDFPLERLTRDLEICAEVVGERIGGRGSELARVLRSGAELVAATPSFLAVAAPR